jgi:CheY-like chemotaxis protein
MGKKVLIVEDNDKNMILERDLLEVEGFEVLEAKNATIGIELVKKEKPDVIVMDVRLPDINGIEAARIIRQNKETCNIPVVFVTASVLDADVAVLKAIPNSSYLSKPIDIHTFVQEIGKYLK